MLVWGGAAGDRRSESDLPEAGRGSFVICLLPTANYTTYCSSRCPPWRKYIPSETEHPKTPDLRQHSIAQRLPDQDIPVLECGTRLRSCFFLRPRSDSYRTSQYRYRYDTDNSGRPLSRLTTHHDGPIPISKFYGCITLKRSTVVADDASSCPSGQLIVTTSPEGAPTTTPLSVPRISATKDLLIHQLPDQTQPSQCFEPRPQGLSMRPSVCIPRPWCIHTCADSALLYRQGNRREPHVRGLGRHNGGLRSGSHRCQRRQRGCQ